MTTAAKTKTYFKTPILIIYAMSPCPPGEIDWEITKRIGKGVCGEVFEAVINGKGVFAIKFSASSVYGGLLRKEQEVYRVLASLPKHIGFAKPYTIWNHEHNGFPFLIIEKLGTSLTDFAAANAISVSFALSFGLQALERIEFLHNINYIHGDIKPGNFVFGTEDRGRGDSQMLYLIDFGLAKRFRPDKSILHIKYREGQPLFGCSKYMSLNAHRGVQQSRRDDIESLGYVLIELLHGSLPWEKLTVHGLEEVLICKEETSPQELCHGLPTEIYQLLIYARYLGFEECPDYNLLRSLFRRD